MRDEPAARRRVVEDFVVHVGGEDVDLFSRGLDRLMKIVPRIGGGPLSPQGEAPKGGPPRRISGFIL